jgi:hypothetical protein
MSENGNPSYLPFEAALQNSLPRNLKSLILLRELRTFLFCITTKVNKSETSLGGLAAVALTRWLLSPEFPSCADLRPASAVGASWLRNLLSLHCHLLRGLLHN